MPTAHSWRFFRAGGVDQVQLETGADLANLDQLDQKLWVALACPTHGLEFDTRTLELIDADHDGRVRAPEVIAAAKWAASLLKNPDDLIAGSAVLPLAAINDALPEGKQILASAKQILANLGKHDATAIGPEDTADTAKIFAATRFNGDGIIPADAASDAATSAAIRDILATCGDVTDRSGKPGIDHAITEAFFTQAEAYSDWWKQAEGDRTILPIGQATVAAAAAVAVVKAKVDDYFARCRLAAFDARALAALNGDEKDFAALAAKVLTTTSPEIAALPLARIEAGKPLPLGDGVNPAWAAAMAELRTAAVLPLIGDRHSLTHEDWQTIVTRLAAFDAWMAGNTSTSVERLGLARVRELVGGPARSEIAALIAQDLALEPEATAIAAVDTLVRFHRDLHTLCVNFVNFRNFYSRRTPAIFQAGRLFLDQRSCDLCLTIEDPGKHAVMAGLAGAYLAYVECVRKASGEKRNILAVFSQGDDDNLMVGRNGIFYDRAGVDFDATITKIVANPISLRQAFWSPYKKLVRFIEEQVAKRAAAAEAAPAANLQNAAEAAAAAAPTKIDTGTLAAIGLVLATVMGALGTVFAKIFGLPAWEIPIAFLAIMLAVSTPSVVIAWLKLRQRNLGPILDANGWAVNASAKMNVPFGASLTQIAALPAGSQRDLVDPFAEKKRPWRLYGALAAAVVLLALVLGWYLGAFDSRLPARLRHGSPAPAPASRVPAVTE
ncbi:MAG TPA: hypothetical protein VMH39_04005 [Gemmatimonadaceae bacterium]|nr:hypothetical protein [Gemmatimonadaceae bacterium]